MPQIKWIAASLRDTNLNDTKKSELIRFWNSFYCHILESTKNSGKESTTKSEQFKNTVFDKLHENKNKNLNDDALRALQIEIENTTTMFDEQSIFKSVPNLINLLIRKNAVNAKDFLKARVRDDVDIELLSVFGQYTIEALIVYVLSMLYSPVQDRNNPAIRVSTLVEQLESSVRTQAALLKNQSCKQALSKIYHNISHNQKRSKLELKYPFGTGLVEFMEERELIKLSNDLSDTVRVPKKKNGSYYLPSKLYAICILNMSLLPIKLNLPMVCKPLDWKSACPPDQKPRYLSDLSGGYLSEPTGALYDRFRLLSSGDINHFYINISHNYDKLCSVMNALQSQAFQINSEWLNNLLQNEKKFVESGYLMPRFLASLNINDISMLLREFHMKDEVINKLFSFSELLNILYKNIQRSRYETLILKLAKAYDGYQFDLPAFLDFRGRIYRSGILHFHERDLARSLILFADCKRHDEEIDRYISIGALAFHFQSFSTIDEGYNWIFKNVGIIWANIYKCALYAKRPFQFFANFNINFKNTHLCKYVPITQDASASAYQIMSYFLLDESMAKRTNLIPSPDGKIQDVYSFIMEELKDFMKAELDNHLSTIVCRELTRKIVKGIFMPMIYGKTLMSTASDLRDELSHFITHKESYDIASVCFKFWRTQYPDMECLIRLIRHIGWISSAKERSVVYRVPYFTTVQDYMKMEPINIWVYNRLEKKRRRMTLRVSSSKRDRRKTETSTFVNFIHQKDAHIAMSVVEEMLNRGAPIYTVHDNFITTPYYSRDLPNIYSGVICKMGPPLSIINEFIYMNIIKPIEQEGSANFHYNCVIPKDTLHSYLQANIPENISKKMLATWEQRISGILTSYENYIRSVCGNFQSSKPWDYWNAHEKKWAKFQSKICPRENIKLYCLHH